MRLVLLTTLACLPLGGCATLPTALRQPQFVENPVTVASQDYELVWDATVRAFEDYFDIVYESRWDGKIVGDPQSAPTLFEPWRPDATGLDDRLYATLQSVRRRAFVDIQPAAGGGFTVSLQIHRELENVRSITADLGGGTLIQSIQPVETTIVDSAVAPAWGWIGLGRDSDLEAKILADLQRRLGGY